MGKFNGPTPKRHRLWSNDSTLLGYIADRAGYMSRADQSACTVKTARVYLDRFGVKRRVGIKEALRSSQNLIPQFRSCFLVVALICTIGDFTSIILRLLFRYGKMMTNDPEIVVPQDLHEGIRAISGWENHNAQICFLFWWLKGLFFQGGWKRNSTIQRFPTCIQFLNSLILRFQLQSYHLRSYTPSPRRWRTSSCFASSACRCLKRTYGMKRLAFNLQVSLDITWKLRPQFHLPKQYIPMTVLN